MRRLPFRAPPAALCLFLVCAAAAAPASAAPAVRLVPASSLVDPAEEFELRATIDAEAETISTFQVVFQFDPNVIEMVEALEGSLYVNSGYTTWFVAEEESLGTWEVWDVIFPGGSFVVAPGELTRLRFRAVAEGVTDIRFLTAEVCDIERYPLEDLEAFGAAVCVGDAATGVETGSADRRDRWILEGPFPNPTGGETVVRFLPPGRESEGECRITIYDARGRAVTAETAARGAGTFVWDGSDRRGGPAAPGVYFIRLVSPEAVFGKRIVLVR